MSKYSKGLEKQRSRTAGSPDDDSDNSDFDQPVLRVEESAAKSEIDVLTKVVNALQRTKSVQAGLVIDAGEKINGTMSEHAVLPEFGDSVRGDKKTAMHQKFAQLDKKVSYFVVSIVPIASVTFESMRILRENIGKDRVVDMTFSPRTGEVSVLLKSSRDQHSALATCDIDRNTRERFSLNCAALKEKTSANEFGKLLHDVVKAVATSKNEMPSGLSYTDTFSPDDDTLIITFTNIPPSFDLSFFEALHRKFVVHGPQIKITSSPDPSLTITLKPRQTEDLLSGKKRK